MNAALIFIRDRRFFSRPSAKFLRRRAKRPYPGGKPHYVLGDPPLGIMYLSAVLREAGHGVRLTDQCHPEYSDERFVASLSGPKRPDLVGISFLSNMCYPAARDLARQVKAALPAARVVLGGVFATINARRIIETEPAVDVVVRGAGEETIRELATRPARLDDIAGLTFRAPDGAAVATPDRPPCKDLDGLPFPDRDGLDINYVASLPLDVPAVIWDRPFTSVLSSRGCPFACTFCNCPTFSGRKCSLRSAGNVLQELDELRRRGYGAFAFVDDNFLLNPQRATEICDGMVARGQILRWACQGRAVRQVHPVFPRLAAAGCDLVMFGIESGSQRVLDALNKKTQLPDVAEAVACARRAGIGLIHGFFIVGSPGETADEVRASFAFAERLPINSFNFNSLTVFRGTTLWQDAVTRGLIDDERDWDRMFPAHAIYPDALDSATLFQLRSRLVRRLIRRKIICNPWQALKLARRLLDCMSLKDIYRLLTSTKSDHTRQRV